MSYVIYHKQSKHLLNANDGSNTFSMPRTAKAVLTKAVNAGRVKREDYEVATYDEWVKVDVMIEVISLMNGKPTMIRSSDKGCRASDPSMEGYWTM